MDSGKRRVPSPYADLFDYMLTGEKTSEYTIASTGTLLDANKRDYSFDLIEKCGIPTRIFKPIVQPGTKCGVLLPSLKKKRETRDYRNEGCFS